MATNRGCMLEEILFDILTRLSVKSLCRFRCVSKLWFSIISDPDFVAAHLERSRSSPKLLISVISVDPGYNIHICSFFSMNYPQQDFSAQPLRATFNSSVDFGYSYMISPSPSGLICFTCSDGIKIGNPITRDMDLIPYPVSDIFCEKSFFGFDPVGKRHVILKLEKHDSASGPSCSKSRVFDLLENCWYDTCPHPWISSGDSSICIDGVIYFTASLGECLYGYDVRLKRFQLIQRPPDSISSRLFVVYLIEYKGCVALVGNSDVDEFRLWILEDPEKHIWSFKSFVVPWRETLIITHGEHPKLCGATHGGELVLVTSLCAGSLYLFFYGIETSTLRRFQVDGFGANLLVGNYPYVKVRLNLVIESLRSPKDFNKKKEEKCSLQLPALRPSS